MRSEEEICRELEVYIDSLKRNRPSVLASLKKAERTPKVVDMVFSRPDIFRVQNEIKYVPRECMSDAVLVKFILARPKELSSLCEEVISVPVLVAFEFAKRRFERLSALEWGSFRERITCPEIYMRYRDDVIALCDSLPSKFDDEDIMKSYLHYIDKMSEQIIDHLKDPEPLNERDKYRPKYIRVGFSLEKRLFINVSGYPDSGKSTFSNLLASKFRDSVCFDSDMLLEKGLLETDLSLLLKDRWRVVVFSDIYASRFFSLREMQDCLVVNILVKPASIELMYRNSKHMQMIPFEDYKKYEIQSIHYEDLTDAIVVENDYTDRIAEQVDYAIDKIIEKLGEFGIQPDRVDYTEFKGTSMNMKKKEQ